jgi:hypothetical protein
MPLTCVIFTDIRWGQYLCKCPVPTTWQVSVRDKCLSNIPVVGKQPNYRYQCRDRAKDTITMQFCNMKDALLQRGSIYSQLYDAAVRYEHSVHRSARY